MRSLITGVGGFAGSHLADYLLAEHASAGETTVEVWGCDLSGSRRPFHPPALHLLAADLRDADAARTVIEIARPDRVYHLAGQAHVGDSWTNPWETIETNLRAQINLLEAIVQIGLRPRVLVVGSADEYGPVAPAELPLDETRPLRPDSPYGVSKIGQDMLGLQYFLSHQLPVVRVRPFNHIGPRQSQRFVAAGFAAQIAAIEAGRQPPIMQVGNLAARRDFTDVRDVVRAYVLALEMGELGEVYNIGTGRSRAVADVLARLLDLSTTRIKVKVNSDRLRPSDLPDLVCNAARLRARTGWVPRIPWEQTLRDLLDFERTRVAEAANVPPA